MDLPVRFPTQTEVIDEEVARIDEEVARFRALPPGAQVRAIVEVFNEFHQFIAASGREAEFERFAEEEEARGRAAIQDFLVRHG